MGVRSCRNRFASISRTSTEEFMSIETDGSSRDPAGVLTESPAVASPGDGDAPDAPDSQTVYPDEQGVPGDPAAR
jgi:hypothetical protein